VSIKTSSFEPKKKESLRSTIFLLDFSKGGEQY
jgi:hypothetical protein